jgi:hypothetical protein
MAEHEEIRQPDTVSERIAEYLEMTAPRTRGWRRRGARRADPEGSPRSPLDNRGLNLEEGNDFA